LVLGDSVFLEQSRNLWNKLCRKGAGAKGNYFQRARCFSLKLHKYKAAVLAGCVDTQDQHGEFRISIAQLHQLEQDSAGALWMDEDIAVATCAALDFLRDQAHSLSLEPFNCRG
jgi:small ligand-binding sensory domain FIST